jgi:hypothetical protein
MQDLQLIGVHEDGEHLLLSGPGDERFRMPVDDALRAAIRRDRPRLGQLQIEVDGGLRPRDVQALIRAGASADEAARRAGWSVEKVHRYEGPILAEREHVATLAQQARLRSRSHGANSGTPTLAVRVTERLKERDVEVTDASWDSWRTEGRPWTVVLTFAAGGRQRQASWTYDLADRTVSAVDDEARWLSEEVQEARGPIPAPRQPPVSGRRTTVYDVEADGGLRPGTDEPHQEDPLDLMTAMRKRSTARGRRKAGGRGGSAPSKPAVGAGSAERDSPQQTAPAALAHHEQGQPEQRLPEYRPDVGLASTPGPADARPGAGPTQRPDDEADDLRSTAQAQFSREREPHDRGLNDRARNEPSAGSAYEDLPSGDRAEEIRGQGDLDQVDGGVGNRAPAPLEEPAGQDRSTSQPRKRGRETARKTGRPSVPAWDEIMFGSKSGVDRSTS